MWESSVKHMIWKTSRALDFHQKLVQKKLILEKLLKAFTVANADVQLLPCSIF